MKRWLKLMAALALMALAGPWPVLAGDVIITKGGKQYQGWASDKGVVTVYDQFRRVIYFGSVTKGGSFELRDLRTSEDYVGKVNPSGKGQLVCPKTADIIKVEMER
jgi:hypothetical protein